MRILRIFCGVAILSMFLAPAAHADEWNKLTYFTFSAPVELPGIVLPGGTYRFELADPSGDRRMVRVSDKDGSKVYGTFFSMPSQRMRPAEKTLVMFREAPAGSPQAARAWFYPGESYGYEFIYPHRQALKIARANHEPVLSTAGDTTGNDSSVAVARLNENDTVTSADEQLKDSSVLPPPASANQVASATPTPDSTIAVGTSGEAVNTVRTRRHLPRTASSLPLLELLSGLSLGLGLSLRARRALL